jgi:hypothetical protein
MKLHRIPYKIVKQKKKAVIDGKRGKKLIFARLLRQQVVENDNYARFWRKMSGIKKVM